MKLYLYLYIYLDTEKYSILFIYIYIFINENICLRARCLWNLKVVLPDQELGEWTLHLVWDKRERDVNLPQ